MQTLYLYRRERLLGERPGCSPRRRENGSSDDRGDPLHSVQVEAQCLKLS
jgi:hypothetical protein